MRRHPESPREPQAGTNPPLPAPHIRRETTGVINYRPTLQPLLPTWQHVKRCTQVIHTATTTEAQRISGGKHDRIGVSHNHESRCSPRLASSSRQPSGASMAMTTICTGDVGNPPDWLP
ncbi:hypothetical protein BPORC_1757 [Bifidobacterium porcinum]|nr:hypothetical protein BPORC_1757 [Bifidobacterium porcinum]